MKMHAVCAAIVLLACAGSAVGAAGGGESARLAARFDTNLRAGGERSILMTEVWFPVMQSADSVLYGDLRLMGDDQHNREGNLGVGYRVITNSPLLGSGVAGANAWVDRRITARGSVLHQLTLGGEWFGDVVDVRVNGYVPLNGANTVSIPNANPQAAALAGTGILIDTNGRLLEEPQHGFDVELGAELGGYSAFIRRNTDALRVYGGGYYFNGSKTEDVVGWRTRVTADISPALQIGARFQRDDERGSQGFLEATLRFPFDAKRSYRKKGLRGRLDDSPERDIDIVTGSTITDAGSRVAVINKETGTAQEVLHVKNDAAGGGDGSAENPFNTLADAETAASAQSIIYVNAGDGTDTNQDQGITLNKAGQQLIGSGSNFLFDNGTFTTANGATPTSLLITQASTAPVIGNVNANQDGVTISADNITVAGLTIDNNNTGRDGVVVKADTPTSSALNTTIENVTAQNNRMGVYIHGTNSGQVSAKVQSTVVTSNSQHGIAVYDDTDATFEADLGGGSMNSAGNNVLAGNTLEDLAVEYDGRQLAAQNNWWGQATGADTDTPDIGIRPQIYYGAPINDDLVGHWTFDTEWTTNTTAYDRSAEGNDGTLQGGLTLADQVTGDNRQALDFDANKGVVVADDVSLDIANNLTILTYIDKDTTHAAYATHPISKWTGTLDANFVLYDFGITAGAGQDLNAFYANRGGVWGTVAQSYYNPPANGNEYVAISYDSAVGGQMYINGSAHGGLIASGVLATNNIPLRLGGYNGFDGKMDDVRIYNKTLAPSEISELYRMDTSSSVDASSFRDVTAVKPAFCHAELVSASIQAKAWTLKQVQGDDLTK